MSSNVSFESVCISEHQCNKIIQQKLKSNFKIKSIKQISSAEINGYLGEHTTLKIQVESEKCEQNLSFFVKSPPMNDAQRALLDEINGFYKEAQFFTKYQTQLKKHNIKLLENVIPQCFYANEQIIVLEDLKISNYQTFSPRETLSLDCIKLGLITFAKLHASGFILQEQEKKKLNEEFKLELQESFYQSTEICKKVLESCKHGVRAIIDLACKEDSMKISKKQFLKLALEGVDQQRSFIIPSNKFKNTICHADPWSKNFMFRFDSNSPTHCVLVDFQTYRYGPPAQDVMAYLYLVAERQVREKHFNQLINYYHSNLEVLLEEYGFKNYLPKDEFFANCAYFKQFAIIQHITHFQLVALGDDIGKELLLDQDLAQKVTFSNKYDFISYACSKDLIYREKLYNAIIELKEFYEEMYETQYLTN